MNNENQQAERIQKVLSAQGFGSRRQIEKWIEEGQVRVNGQPATIGMRITTQDKIMLHGKPVVLNAPKFFKTKVIMYNKPEGEVVTLDDPDGRPTVFEQLPNLRSGRWVNVGRLDINTTGLLLLTNDGELANRLMKPNFQIERKYAVRVLGDVLDEHVDALLAGVELEDGFAKFETVQYAGGTGANSWYHVTIKEGRKREVRRLWEAVDMKVSRLIRIAFGPILLPPRLKVGDYQYLTEDEVEALLKLTGMRAS